MEQQQESTQVDVTRLSSGSRKRRGRRPHKAKAPLLTRDTLDQRTNAAKFFRRMVAAIEVDLAGRENLSTIERALIEAFAGAAVTLQHLNTKLALGEEIDLSQHAQCVSAMVRVASRLGLRRRQKDPLTLEGYLNSLKEDDQHKSRNK